MANLLQTLMSNIQSYPERAEYGPLGHMIAAMANVGQVQFGTYTGTGSALEVVIAGNPRLVLLYDATQATLAVNWQGMAAASYVLTSTMAVVAANGITLGTNKFTIGTDGDINTGSDVGYWVAII